MSVPRLFVVLTIMVSALSACGPSESMIRSVTDRPNPIQTPDIKYICNTEQECDDVIKGLNEGLYKPPK